jgi:hypothetical protein
LRGILVVAQNKCPGPGPETFEPEGMLLLFDAEFDALRGCVVSSVVDVDPIPRAFNPPPVLFLLSMIMIPEADVLDLS